MSDGKIHHIHTGRWASMPSRMAEACEECGVGLSNQPALHFYIPKGKPSWPNYFLCIPCADAFALNLMGHVQKLLLLAVVPEQRAQEADRAQEVSKDAPATPRDGFDQWKRDNGW